MTYNGCLLIYAIVIGFNVRSFVIGLYMDYFIFYLITIINEFKYSVK